MECGGKRSATPLWLVFVPYPSQDEPLSQSGVALRLPPHSIKSRSVTDSFNHKPSGGNETNSSQLAQHGQREKENRTFAGSRFYPYLPAVTFDNLFANGQSHAC